MKEFVISRIPKASKSSLEKLCKKFGRKQYEILQQAIDFFANSDLDPKEKYTPSMRFDEVAEYISKRYSEDQIRIKNLENRVKELEDNAYKIRVSLTLKQPLGGSEYYHGKFSVGEVKELFPA